LKDQLLKLLKLQTIDARVKELEASMKTLPARLEPARRDLSKLETMLVGEKQRLTETETWKRQQEVSLEREQDALKSAKAKLQQSKTGKEYNAASREVDNKRKAISDKEAELKKLTETVTQTQQQVTAHDKDVDDVKRHLSTEEAGIADKVAALAAEIIEASSGREDVRATIEPKWLKIYDTLSAKKGYAVAPVLKGTCQGCHMSLPPQLNNILARMESFEVCPRCARIIYRKELIEPPVPAEGDGAGDGAKT
jgi:predicted  nucleic acid-binding Zn-ribbon protein